MIASSCKQNFSKRVKHEIHTTDSEAYSEPSQASKMALRKKICRYSVRMREHTDQSNSEYGHFSRAVN